MSKSASYTLVMSYDNMHRITSKSQHLTQDNVQFNGTLNVGYDLSYTYGTEAGKKFQLASVKDVNYRTEETPGGNNIENNHVYLYDKNGNLVYVNTGRMMNDGHNEVGTRERKLIWDEENRLLAVDDNGFVSNYWYDADGERTVKTSGESDQVYVNGVFSGGSTNTAKFSLYVSPYLVANQGGRYTKHIYAGSQRIVSKVGDFASYGSDPRRIEYAGANTDGLSVDYKSKYAAQQQVIKDNYKFFDVPYNGTDNDNYADGEGFCCNDGSMEAAVAEARKAQARAVSRSFKDPDNYENLQFFYHPDHLGSSSFITNLEGEVVQHIEYVPFGEVFIEERNNVWNTPYLFNAKEFDEETGMYYYGARYYDPRLSLWISSDPLGEKYPNLNSYCYTACNPVNAVDPDGNVVIFVNGQHWSDGGSSDYWEKLDKRILRKIGDNKALYYDGADGGWGNTFFKPIKDFNVTMKNRVKAGYDKGYSEAAKIFAPNFLEDGETIKFITHSMGGAYTKGFIKGLQDYASQNGLDISNLIEFEVDFAPFQPTKQQAVKGVRTIVVQHLYDGIAMTGDMPGAETTVTHKDIRLNGFTFWLAGFKEHSIKSFVDDVEQFVPTSEQSTNK